MTTQYVTPQEAGVKVGDYFYGSWGYDQTNVNWFKVVGLTPKCVKVQEVYGATVDDDGGPVTYVKPSDTVKVGGWKRTDCGSEYDPNLPAPVKTKRIQKYGDYVALAWKSYASLTKWDGTPKYQTGFGWGH